MKTKPTEEQNKKALAIIHQINTSANHKAVLVTEAQLQSEAFFKLNANRWWIKPAFVVDNRYYCAWDVYWGNDIVVDLKSQALYFSKKGVFEKDFVFISDYYGFDKGAFYYASN